MVSEMVMRLLLVSGKLQIKEETTAVRNFATIAGFTGVSGNVTARMFVYGVSRKKFNLKKYRNFMLVVPKVC